MRIGRLAAMAGLVVALGLLVTGALAADMGMMAGSQMKTAIDRAKTSQKADSLKSVKESLQEVDCRGRHAKGRGPYPALSTSVLTTGWPPSTQACHPPSKTATCVYPCSWRNRATRALVASSRQVQYATASRSRGTSP